MSRSSDPYRLIVEQIHVRPQGEIGGYLKKRSEDRPDGLHIGSVGDPDVEGMTEPEIGGKVKRELLETPHGLDVVKMVFQEVGQPQRSVTINQR